jgi:hypothetical protein
MAATIVQSAEGTSTSATTTASFSTTPTNGNVIILAFAADDYNGTPNSGWTQSTGMEQQTYHGGYIWWKVASGGSNSFQYTVGSATNSSWVLLEVSGLDAAPYDISAGQCTNSSDGSYTTPSITPTAGDRLLLAAIGSSNNSGDMSADLTGWTNSFTHIRSSGPVSASGTRDSIGVASRDVTANGSTGYSTGASFPFTKQSHSGMIIAFKVASGGGGQSITGSLFTNSNSFYGATVGRGTVNISGALYSDADTFYAATLGKTYAITGARFDNSAQFYAATVAPGTVTISGALFTDGDTFYAATVGRGDVNIAGSLYTDPDSFYAATVTQPGSSPVWVAWANVAASTAATSVAPVIPTGSTGDLLILSAGCIGSNTAFVVTKSGADDWNLIADFDVGTNRVGFWWKRKEAGETAPTVSNAGRTSTNLLTSAIDSYTGSLGSGDPIINVSQAAVTSGAIIGPALTTTRSNSLAVTRFMRLGANTATTPTAPWVEDRDNGTSGGGGARFYGDSQTVLTPSTVTASNRGGSGANFGAVAFEIVSESAAEQAVSGGLFSNANAFYGSTVSASYTVSGALYSDADAFYAATVSTSYAIAGSLYTDADTFFAASISQPNTPQTITGQLYANDNQFFGGVVAGGASASATSSGGVGTTWARKTLSQIEREKKAALKRAKKRVVQIIEADPPQLGELLQIVREEVRQEAVEFPSTVVNDIISRLHMQMRAALIRRIEEEDEADAEFLLLVA